MDLIEFLEENNIEYWEEGKNVSAGWTGLNCPFCNDPSNHGGISPDRTAYNCFRCGKSTVAKYIKEKLECSWNQAITTANKLADYGEGGAERGSLGTSPPFDSRRAVFPVNSTKDFPALHHKYLTGRGFVPDYLVKKYKLRAVHTIGRYRFRIIVPYFLNGIMVTYVARDISGKAESKYITCPERESIITFQQTFYNIDRAKKRSVIVEGVFDVWRIGDGCIGSSNATLTDRQIDQLIDVGVEEVLLVFDTDALEQANRYARQLFGIVKHVEIADLEGGDPAEADPRTIGEIKQWLKGGR